MTDRMAILGEGDSVLAFKAGGVDAYYASDREQAKDILRKLAKEYAVIFITEKLLPRKVVKTYVVITHNAEIVAYHKYVSIVICRNRKLTAVIR